MITFVVSDIWRTAMKQYIQSLEIWLTTIFQKHPTTKKLAYEHPRYGHKVTKSRNKCRLIPLLGCKFLASIVIDKNEIIKKKKNK